MKRSFFASRVAPGAVVALVSSVCLCVRPVAGWAQTTQSEGAPPTRTPWGDPDIGGLWSSSTVTPLERPEAQADKEFLTEEEAAAIERQVVDRNSRANAPSVVRTELLVRSRDDGYPDAAHIADRRPPEWSTSALDPGCGTPAQLCRQATAHRCQGGARAGRFIRAIRLGRSVHLVPWHPVVAHRVQQQLSRVPDARVCGHSPGAHPRRSRHPPGWPPTRRPTCSRVRRRLAGPLGRRDARSRNDQFQQSGLPLYAGRGDRRVGRIGISPRPCVWSNALRA